MSKENFTLFVGDLSLFCNASHLKQAFSKYGEITAVRIAFDDQSQKQLHFGFVEFATYDSAMSALSAMNGTVLCGRILKVKWAINRSEASTEENKKASSYKLETSSIHVNFLSYQTSKLVSEEHLRSIFSSFGEVKDVIIKKSTKENGIQRGYGFVHYGSNPEGIHSTLTAIANMFDVTIDNVNYTCAMSHACEQGFIGFGSPFMSGSHSSGHSSGQASPYLPMGVPSDGYFVQGQDIFVPNYTEQHAAPPSQFYLYPASNSNNNCGPANFDQYHSHQHQLPPNNDQLMHGSSYPGGYCAPMYQDSLHPSPANLNHSGGQMLPNAAYYGAHAGSTVYTTVPQHYVYHHPQQQQQMAPPQPPAAQYALQHTYYNPQHPQQQQQQQQQHHLPPTHSNHYYRPDNRPRLSTPGRPGPFLLASVGRSHSEPLSIPPLPINTVYTARQYHSSHELSPKSGNSALSSQQSTPSTQSRVIVGPAAPVQQDDQHSSNQP